MHQITNNILSIETPEGICFSLKLAGPAIRFLAWLMDLMCISVITKLLSTLIYAFVFISQDLTKAITLLAYFAVSVGYSIVLEYYWRGQTIGKRLFRISVMDAQGLHLQFNQIAIRNLLRFVDRLPLFYLIGGVAGLLTKKVQRLGDVAANTIVVWSPKIPKPDLDQIMPDKYNSMHDYPHIKARLKQKISPGEAGLALQALLRREQLDPNARIALFSNIAAHFKELAAFPAEAVDGISEERYLRNVLDVLYSG